MRLRIIWISVPVTRVTRHPINMARGGGCGDPRSEAPFVAPLNYSEDCVSGNSEYVLVLCERVLQLKITSFLL